MTSKVSKTISSCTKATLKPVGWFHSLLKLRCAVETSISTKSSSSGFPTVLSYINDWPYN